MRACLPLPPGFFLYLPFYLLTAAGKQRRVGLPSLPSRPPVSLTATDPDASDAIRARACSGYPPPAQTRFPRIITGAFGPGYDAVFRRQKARCFLPAQTFQNEDVWIIGTRISVGCYRRGSRPTILHGTQRHRTAQAKPVFQAVFDVIEDRKRGE